MKLRYKVSIVGGTFDHLHSGHETLLKAAFKESEHVMIGLTTPQLYENKLLAGSIEDFNQRKSHLVSFLTSHDLLERAEIMPIHDFYGNTLTEKNVDALFVTEETKHNVTKINYERKKRGLTETACVVVPFVLGDDGQTITSARIRAGEIDRQGHTYIKLFTRSEKLILPDSVRSELRKPIGEISSNIQEVLEQTNDKILISVGDVVSLSLYQAGHQAAVSVIDMKTRREAMGEEEKTILQSFQAPVETNNPAGTLQSEAVQDLQAAIKAYLHTQIPQTLIVHGEEDLLVIPAVLLAPLGAIVLYGQFDQGVVAVHVTEEKKKQMIALINKFE